MRYRKAILRRSVSAVAGALVASTVLSAATVSASAHGTVKEYALPAGNPIGITAGPDGNIWFTTSDAKLGRITRSGHITEFTIPQPPPCTTNCPAAPGPPPPAPPPPPPPPPSCAPDCLPQGREITTGPDGNLWFTQPFSSFVARAVVSEDAVSFSEYPTPSGCHPPYRFCLDGITSGPDGNLWFTEPIRHKIGRLVPSTGAITEYAGAPFPLRITAGPDGNLWFGDNATSAIGRITTSGAVTEFPMPNPELSHGGPAPNPDADADIEDSYGYGVNGGVVVGGDGNLWINVGAAWVDGPPSTCPVPPANDDSCSGFPFYPTSDWLVAVSPFTGTVQNELRIATGSNPQDFALGSDGNIWIPENGAIDPTTRLFIPGMQVGSLSLTGQLTEYVTPTPNSRPLDITAAPDQTIWFTEQGHIGRIKICGEDCTADQSGD